MHMSDVIDVRGGFVTLGGRPVLRGVDLSVGRGQVVAVVGSNGSGKSTLVRAMVGLVPLHQGEVRLFGEPLAGFRDWSRIGYVPQRATAGAGVPATVGEVVASGRLGHRRLLRPMRRADRAAVRRAIDAVELADRRGDAVGQLSGGQQQRVLIARALAVEPDLFLLDEPNAGVDRHSQARLAQTLGSVVSEGATALLVLHELGPLAHLIDRVVVMVDGRITYDGSPQGAVSAGHVDDHHPPAVPDDNVPLRGGWQL
jgi:zinc transport system ATP-binding protein